MATRQFRREQAMKVAAAICAIFAVGLFSLALGKGSESTTIAWLCGYFAAVIITTIDRLVFKP